jgi:hypothetical protein
MLRKLVLGLTLAGAAASPLVGAAEAAVGDGVAAAPVAQLLPVEKTQFFFGGGNYCFYPDGWQGPGFYWCGYAWRTGSGWGGPEGWHGWHGGDHGHDHHMGGEHHGGEHHGGEHHGDEHHHP